MEAIVKSPLTSLFGVAAAAAAYVVGHPAEFAPIFVTLAGALQPISLLLLGCFAGDHNTTKPQA